MRLSVVIPCYNEEAVLAECVAQVLQLLDDLAAKGKISPDSNLWLVDDGSRDSTWQQIEQLAAQHANITGVKLSRNRGHQNALLAGLMSADGDAVISLDADLQDDTSVVEEMVDAHLAGNEVVFGVRRSRVEDTFFKRWSARRYYALLRALGVDVVPDHAEFRLLGRNALQALAEYPETNLFLRGLIPQLGFRTARVLYDRRLRLAGHTKYPLGRMLGLGIDGITSFSAVPLRMIAATGALLFLFSMGVSLWVLGVKLFTDHAVPGWASTTLPIYALGGVQLLSLGLVGEYVAKIYVEVKRRPRYIIERMTSDRVATPGRVR
jgi:glycosyltransferase involved in cell wall biosynthesis